MSTIVFDRCAHRVQAVAVMGEAVVVVTGVDADVAAPNRIRYSCRERLCCNLESHLITSITRVALQQTGQQLGLRDIVLCAPSLGCFDTWSAAMTEWPILRCLC